MRNDRHEYNSINNNSNNYDKEAQLKNTVGIVSVDKLAFMKIKKNKNKKNDHNPDLMTSCVC